MSKQREPGFYWVVYWANDPKTEAEIARWTGTEWEIIGESRTLDDEDLAWIGDERQDPPTIDIANLRPQGRS
jgi:hypothetical protein